MQAGPWDAPRARRVARRLARVRGSGGREHPAAACSTANMPKIRPRPLPPPPAADSPPASSASTCASWRPMAALRRSARAGDARPDRRQARGSVRAAGPEIRSHDPELARGQRLRAAQRPALCHPRADRARQRQLRARLGDGPRDGACDRPPRRDPRGPGPAGGAGQPRRHRPAERSAARRARARQIEDRARQLLARPGVRGRRHRRRHLRARRLRPLRRRALPHLDGPERASARAARRIDPRAPDFLSSHPATPERVTNAVANARQFTGPGAGARDRRRNISRWSTGWSMARTRARASCAAAGSCIPSSASPSPRRTASRSTTRRRRCSASRTAARRRSGSTWCACRPSSRCRNISTPAGSRTSRQRASRR